MAERIALTANGRPADSVAAALLATPGEATRISVSGEPRGPPAGVQVEVATQLAEHESRRRTERDMPAEDQKSTGPDGIDILAGRRERLRQFDPQLTQATLG